MVDSCFREAGFALGGGKPSLPVTALMRAQLALSGATEFLRSVNFQVRDRSRRALVSSPAIRLCQDLKAMYCMPFRLEVRVVLAPSEMWKVARGVCVNCLGSFGALQGPADSRDSGCRSK